MTTKKPDQRHRALRATLIQTLAREFADLPGEEMLAVACQLVGQMIAMQDQRRYTPETIMKLVQANIEAGNQQAVAQFLAAPGGHA